MDDDDVVVAVQYAAVAALLLPWPDGDGFRSGFAVAWAWLALGFAVLARAVFPHPAARVSLGAALALSLRAMAGPLLRIQREPAAAPGAAGPAIVAACAVTALWRLRRPLVGPAGPSRAAEP